MAVKAVLGLRVSLIAFGIAQIAIDLEPLIRIVRGDPVVHGATHTWAGAIVVALLCHPLARWLGPPLLRRWRRELSAARLDGLDPATDFARGSIMTGLLLGTLSHVALDSIMHADMQPLWPLAAGNPMLLMVDIDALHVGCFAAGIAGATGWLLIRWQAQRRARRARDPARPPT